MWRLALSAAAVALLAACPTTGAQAQENEINCNAFVTGADGSWTVIEKVYIPVQKVRVREGVVFRPGETFLGDDMAARLEKACPNQPVATAEGQPAGPAGQPVAQSPEPPHVPLSTYADANGDIDARRLSCAHLAALSGEESELLLAWYSGWYGGIAKRRGINLARVRYAIHNVADYCKGNREKSLAQVMELMLK